MTPEEWARYLATGELPTALEDLPPDPFYDSSSCPISSCTTADRHTHDNDDPRLPLNRQEATSHD